VTARQLKSARKLAGLSQIRLERLTGLPRQKIGLVENGNADLTRAEMLLIRRALADEIGKRAKQATRFQARFAAVDSQVAARLPALRVSEEVESSCQCRGQQRQRG
jgi:transcriptional regulator with XRE-family HTH domain